MLNDMSNKKKNILPIVFLILIVIAAIGVTYAFFNYTRTGGANTVRTGKINFNTSQNDSINLTNIFPIDPEETGVMDDSTKVGSIAINVTGDTSYDKGVEYLVSAINVNNTVGTGANKKEIPISIAATVSGTLGTSDDNYFSDRDTTTSHIYKLLAGSTISEGSQLLVGYIAKGESGINGTITIKAYIDKNNIAISDTYDGTESSSMGTTSDWVNGREVFKTEEWNNLQGTGVSFQIKVEANEGVWVEEKLSINVMNTFIGNIMSKSNSIKEIYFNRMSDNVMQSRYDASEIKSDLTYNNEGRVLCWLEQDTVDNTKYIMYVASNGKTYLTTGGGLLAPFGSSLEKVEFNNVDTSRVTTMSSMFAGCSKLTTLNLSGLGSNSLTSVEGIFYGCINLINIDMSNFNFGNVTVLSSGSGTGIFDPCCNCLQSINLSNANTSNVTNMSGLFANCRNLENIDLTGIDTGNVTNMSHLFWQCSKLKNIDLRGFDTSKVTTLIYFADRCSLLESVNLDGLDFTSVTDMTYMFRQTALEIIDFSNVQMGSINGCVGMFQDCRNLKTIYVSQNWNFANSQSGSDSSNSMFNGCISLVGGNNTAYDSLHTNGEYARIDGGVSNPGYFTLSS